MKVDPIFYYSAFSSDTCPPSPPAAWRTCAHVVIRMGGGGRGRRSGVRSLLSRKCQRSNVGLTPPRNSIVTVNESETHKKCPGRFMGITGQILSVAKSNHFHIDILVFKM